jgi:major membrane immunogen (membrane-anchored lipoprotein)
MTHRLLLLTCCVLALTACGEKDQTLGSKKDGVAYAGTANGFSAQGWKAGDKNSWEQQLRTRGQYGMNDHSRVPD